MCGRISPLLRAHKQSERTILRFLRVVESIPLFTHWFALHAPFGTHNSQPRRTNASSAARAGLHTC